MARSFSSKESRFTNKEHRLVEKGNGFPRRMRKASLTALEILESRNWQQHEKNILSQQLRWKRKERKIYQLEESVEKDIVLGFIQQIFIEHISVLCTVLGSGD